MPITAMHVTKFVGLLNKCAVVGTATRTTSTRVISSPIDKQSKQEFVHTVCAGFPAPSDDEVPKQADQATRLHLAIRENIEDPCLPPAKVKEWLIRCRLWGPNDEIFGGPGGHPRPINQSTRCTVCTKGGVCPFGAAFV